MREGEGEGGAMRERGVMREGGAIKEREGQ